MTTLSDYRKAMADVASRNAAWVDGTALVTPADPIPELLDGSLQTAALDYMCSPEGQHFSQELHETICRALFGRPEGEA